jgi:hypothetical protein
MQVLIDDRERSVITFVEKFSEKYHISYKVKRITTGDYAIIHSNQIIAIIERKTYTDLAASFRDGRSNNKNKLLKLSSETSCIIIYLIEGPAFPDNNDLFGNVPYKHLVAHLDHLMIRDNIQIQTTFSPEHSAERIMQIAANCTTIRPTIFTDKYINKVIINVDDPENKEDILQIEMKNNTEDDQENEDMILISELKPTDKKKKIQKHKEIKDSYEESNKKIIHEIKQNLVKQELMELSSDQNEVVKQDETIGSKESEDNILNNKDLIIPESKINEIIEQTAESILSKKQESEINIREYMLQLIPGVGNVLSTILSDANINLKKLILSLVDVDSIAKLKYSTGGSVGLIKAGKIIDSCRMLANSKSQVANKIRMKILHAIPLISKPTAEKILSSIEFKSLFTDEQIYLAIQNIYKSPKNKIGIKSSSNMKKYLYD